MLLRLRVLVAAASLVVGGSAPVVAQEQGGSIQGIVKDSSGGVLPGVTIEARSPSAVGVSIAVTDNRGEYRFPALPAGTYDIKASLLSPRTPRPFSSSRRTLRSPAQRRR